MKKYIKPETQTIMQLQLDELLVISGGEQNKNVSENDDYSDDAGITLGSRHDYSIWDDEYE